jgi:hypothetical protein
MQELVDECNLYKYIHHMTRIGCKVDHIHLDIRIYSTYSSIKKDKSPFINISFDVIVCTFI